MQNYQSLVQRSEGIERHFSIFMTIDCIKLRFWKTTSENTLWNESEKWVRLAYLKPSASPAAYSTFSGPWLRFFVRNKDTEKNLISLKTLNGRWRLWTKSASTTGWMPNTNGYINDPITKWTSNKWREENVVTLSYWALLSGSCKVWNFHHNMMMNNINHCK